MFGDVREHIAQMVGGPGWFRFFLQPTVAVILGAMHGLADRRAGRPVYFAALIRHRKGRAERLRQGARAVVVPFVVALIAAFTFQYIVRGRIFLGYGLLYAIGFVLVPYLIARGLAHRLARARTPKGTQPGFERGGPRWTHETRNPG
jgi:hypothetical protein